MDRFWSKVDKSGGPGACWPWTGARLRRRGGYGAFNAGDDKIVRAHRFAWELVNGPIPQGEGWHGTVVRHLCHNVICCNPEHLAVGSTQDNIDDKVVAGRQPRGETNSSAKLTESDVRKAFELRRQGYTYKEISARIGTTPWNIQAMCTGRSWKHLGLIV